MTIKLQSFSFDSKQNTRTILIIARREGFETIEAALQWLDRELSEDRVEGRKQRIAEDKFLIGRDPNRRITEKESRRLDRKLKAEELQILARQKELIASAKACPSCGNGKLINPADGEGYVLCLRPEGVNRIKMKHGCGYSEYIESE